MKNLRIQEAFDASVLETPYVVLVGNDIVHYGPFLDSNNDVQPNDEIWYYTTDNNAVVMEEWDEIVAYGENANITYYKEYGFTKYDYDYEVEPLTLISNTYENGKGILKFSGDIKLLSNREFFRYQEDYNLIYSISLPNSIEVLEGYHSDEGVFGNYSRLTSIKLPSNLKIIGDECLGCNLSSLTLPDTLLSIGYVFSNENLSEITLPKSIEYMDAFAFSYSENLSTINYKGTMSEFYNIYVWTLNDDYGIFNECPATKIHCTDGDILISDYNEYFYNKWHQQ